MLPRCIVLQTPASDHLGFLLLVPGDLTHGDCIFSIIPKNPAVFDHPSAQQLFPRRDVGESRYTLDCQSGFQLRIVSAGLPDLIIELDENGKGIWRDDVPETNGGCALIPTQTE